MTPNLFSLAVISKPLNSQLDFLIMIFTLYSYDFNFVLILTLVKTFFIIPWLVTMFYDSILCDFSVGNLGMKLFLPLT